MFLCFHFFLFTYEQVRKEAHFLPYLNRPGPVGRPSREPVREASGGVLGGLGTLFLGSKGPFLGHFWVKKAQKSLKMRKNPRGIDFWLDFWRFFRAKCPPEPFFPRFLTKKRLRRGPNSVKIVIFACPWVQNRVGWPKNCDFLSKIVVFLSKISIFCSKIAKKGLKMTKKGSKMVKNRKIPKFGPLRSRFFVKKWGKNGSGGHLAWKKRQKSSQKSIPRGLNFQKCEKKNFFKKFLKIWNFQQGFWPH